MPAFTHDSYYHWWFPCYLRKQAVRSLRTRTMQHSPLHHLVSDRKLQLQVIEYATRGLCNWAVRFLIRGLWEYWPQDCLIQHHNPPPGPIVSLCPPLISFPGVATLQDPTCRLNAIEGNMWKIGKCPPQCFSLFLKNTFPDIQAGFPSYHLEVYPIPRHPMLTGKENETLDTWD